jgi:LysR family glycine cleavage system transcriptional activator
MASRPPSLRAIAAFEAAARHQSFSRAAEELNLTHGAISHAIKGLEDRLGSRLFDRRARGVVLTDAGRELSGKVRLSVGLLGEAFEARPWIERSDLIVSVLPNFAQRFVIPRVPRIRAAHPDIRLKFRINERLAGVAEGEVDVALRYGPGRWTGTNASKLADERMFAVTSPAHPAARLKHPRELAFDQLIEHPDFSWKPWFTAAGLPWPDIRIPLAIDESAMLLDAAAAGAGVALARSLLVEPDLRSGRLIRLFDVEIPSPYSYWFVWNPISEKQDAIGRFRDWISGEIEEAKRAGA